MELSQIERKLESYKLKDIVLISTLNGSLEARSRRNGNLLWSIAGSPLVEITNPSIKWMADPLGSLYFFTFENGIERVPAHLSELVQRAPFGLIGKVMYTGSINNSLYGININTGEVVDKFDSSTLVLGMQETVLQIEEHNIGRGTQIIVRQWMPNTRDFDLGVQYQAPMDSLYVSPLSLNTVVAFRNKQQWVQRLDSVMVDVFDVLEGVEGLAMVRQPSLNLNSGAEWDLLVLKDCVLSGVRYAPLYSSLKRASFCDGGKSIRGVHPGWCQNKWNKRPQVGLLPPARISDLPLLDPPETLPVISDKGIDRTLPSSSPAAGDITWSARNILLLFLILVPTLLYLFNQLKTLKPEKKRKRGNRGQRKKRKEMPISVSDVVLGYGSNGTTVFKGRFEDRDVAVKRMLLEFYDVASQEVDILQESDDHPNVVRYYYKHETDQFLYIALELCPLTLEQLVKGDHGQFSIQFNPLDALRQITLGLQHLHSLQIVHRDIKPQNILVALPNKRSSKHNTMGVRYVISDFGLCRKLEGEQSSFMPTAAADSVAGTAGWAAPEISSISTSLQIQRLTKAVDIFSMGCLFYYVLSGGEHPFGLPHMRQVNIQQGNKFELKKINLVDELALDLIPRMICADFRQRISLKRVLLHPLFWTDQMKLDFLVKLSDRLEHDSREEHSELIDDLEKDAPFVVGTDWHQRFPKLFIDNLGKYRRYHGNRIIDLLRALRNKFHHYNDFTPELVECVGTLPTQYLKFFTDRFPNLLVYVYYYGERFSSETAFQQYYEQ